MNLAADAPIELAHSAAVGRAFGVQPRLINSAFIDSGLTRDLTVGSASGGGYLSAAGEQLAVGAPRQANDFLSLCTGINAAPGAGAQTVGRFDALPVVSTLANEAATLSEVSPTTSATVLSPSNAGCYVEQSRHWVLQTEGGARALTQLITNALRTHVGI